MFEPSGKKITFADVGDGLANTIMLVEGTDNTAAIWTKPDDLTVDLKKPLKGLERPGQSFFLALMGDGSVLEIKRDLDPAILGRLFTRNDGFHVDLSQPKKKARIARKKKRIS